LNVILCAIIQNLLFHLIHNLNLFQRFFQTILNFTQKIQLKNFFSYEHKMTDEMNKNVEKHRQQLIIDLLLNYSSKGDLNYVKHLIEVNNDLILKCFQIFLNC
jgi:hypothetical protein